VLEASDDILAFERRAHGEQMLCVFNLGHATRSWSPPDADGWRIVEASRTLRDWQLPGLTGLVAQRNR
jgi:alpha-glucosidase